MIQYPLTSWQQPKDGLQSLANLKKLINSIYIEYDLSTGLQERFEGWPGPKIMLDPYPFPCPPYVFLALRLMKQQ